MASPVETAQQSKPAQLDVFLSYHSVDRERVNAFKHLLSGHGVRAFLDRTDLVVGLPWPQALEEALRSVRAVLVFVGAADGGESLGLWQRREVWFALDRQAQKEGQGEPFPVIPVLLAGARPDAGFLFLNTWVDLREAADGTTAVQAIINAVANITVQPVEVVRATVCPYRALEAFREEDAALFFGRESVAEDLLARVIHRPLVALIGPSGSGKSSVVQAGLIPLLRRQRPPQHAWDTVVFRPGDMPFHRLATSLIPLLEPGADEIDRLDLGRKLGEKLADGTVRIEDVVDRLIAKSNGTDRLLIVADQFEELFTLVPSQQRQPFVTAVLSALDRAPFTLLLSLRADFYGHAIALDRRLSDRIQSGLVNLAPMTREELRRAVEQPAAKADIHFEAGLVDRILDHVELQPGGLPLLEFALTQLWERRDGHRITHAAYEVVGEVEGAISRRAESVFLNLDIDQRRAALSLFTRLLRVAAPDKAEPATRRRIETDLLTNSEHSVLQPFIDARLLVLDRGESTEKQTVEVAHEALTHGWRRLGEWVDQQREFLLWRQRLGQALAEWNRNKRDRSTLLRGPSLKEAVGWMHERKAELSQQEAEFIRRSRGRKRRRQQLLGTLVAVAIVILAAWPGLKLASRTNAFQVWGSVRLAPIKFPYARPSALAAWVHAVDVAGHRDTIGWGIFQFPPPAWRSYALWHAAAVLAYQERTAEAQYLVDQAFELAKQAPDFDTTAGAQIVSALTANKVGRVEMAQHFARRAVALERQQQNPESRAFALARAATVLARVGLAQEARMAIEEARASLPKSAPSTSRAFVDDATAIVLVNLGAVDEALVVASGQVVPVILVEELVDHGYLKQARDFVTDSDDPFVVAVLASALASKGHVDEAKALTRTALALLETWPMGADERGTVRAQFQERLLLRVMTASEAAAFVRERSNPEELAGLAAVLARSHDAHLSRELARDAAGRVETMADGKGRVRALVKVVEALARSGDAEVALSTARAIEEREMRVAALAHVAYGFATEGKKDRAQALLRDVGEVLPSIQDRDQQSYVWMAVAMTNVRLGRYAEALKDEGLTLNPSDEVAVYTAIIQDNALRRNAELRARFDRGPIEGLGKYSIHWP